MILSFSNTPSIADVSHFNGAVVFAARMIGFFCSTGIKRETKLCNCGPENGFQLLPTEHTQTPNTMRQRAIAKGKKPEKTIRHLSQPERRTEVRLGQAHSPVSTVVQQAVAAFRTMWAFVLASCCVLWTNNWYRAQYMTHPDQRDPSQNCTAMAVPQLKPRPAYLAGSPAIKDLAARITPMARLCNSRKGKFPKHCLTDDMQMFVFQMLHM